MPQLILLPQNNGRLVSESVLGWRIKQKIVLLSFERLVTNTEELRENKVQNKRREDEIEKEEDMNKQ